MDNYFIHGCAVGIGVIVEEEGTIDIDLFWLDKFAPPTIDIPSRGIYKIPEKLINQNNTYTIHGIRLIQD